MAPSPPAIDRLLDLNAAVRTKSCFLFGPRQTGKTWLIRNTLSNCLVYNLLDSVTFLALSGRPKRIEEEIQPDTRLVVIDEIQRLPSLLNEVHLLIEERGLRFLLTGSSARKLRRGGVNLLGGRARVKHLHPLVRRELESRFDLLRALNRGLLPSIYFSDDAEEDLKAYAGTYLQEEISAEGLTRNVPAFSRFLQVAALCNGKLINYTNIANDAQVARSTVQEYFHILKDTLIAHEVPAWTRSTKRKSIGTSKFYLFDVGVTRFLQNRAEIRPRSPEFGEAFESYIFHELKSYSDHSGADSPAHWRSTSGFEVDFILGGETAIEVKAKSNVTDRDLKGLMALRQEQKMNRYICVSLDTRPRRVQGAEILPYQSFLDRLWDRDFG